MKISIIMSTFNSENVIENSIKSLLNQSYKDYEILISDDNSTDSTYDILKNYEKNNNLIKVFKNKQNIGLTKSLNKLVSKSNGILIARQDADDISFQNRLEKQVNFIKKYNLDFCTSRAITTPEEKIRPKFSIYFPKKMIIKYKNPFIHGSLLIKKSVIEDLGGYDENFYYAQDYKLMYDLLRNNYKCKILNEVLYGLNTKNNISELKKTEQKYYADCVRKQIQPKQFNENLY